MTAGEYSAEAKLRGPRVCSCFVYSRRDTNDSRDQRRSSALIRLLRTVTEHINLLE